MHSYVDTMCHVLIIANLPLTYLVSIIFISINNTLGNEEEDIPKELIASPPYVEIEAVNSLRSRQSEFQCVMKLHMHTSVSILN